MIWYRHTQKQQQEKNKQETLHWPTTSRYRVYKRNAVRTIEIKLKRN